MSDMLEKRAVPAVLLSLVLLATAGSSLAQPAVEAEELKPP